MKDEGSLHVQSCSAAGAGLPILAHQIVGFGKQNRQSFAANPLVLFNHSIDFVQRFQWICRTIPMDWLRKTGGFLFREHRMADSISAVAVRENGKVLRL